MELYLNSEKMKIIKASVDLKTWCHELTCNKCQSKLGIEAKDLRYKWTTSGCYYFVCELCTNWQYMKDAEVPAIVGADVRKHRSDPIVYRED